MSDNQREILTKSKHLSLGSLRGSDAFSCSWISSCKYQASHEIHDSARQRMPYRVLPELDNTRIGLGSAWELEGVT